MSDMIDALIDNAGQVFSAEALMHALENLPSDTEERPSTPEAPKAPLPGPVKFCVDCGCECQLYGIKWRCTGKHCMKWNGIQEPFGPSGSQWDEIQEPFQSSSVQGTSNTQDVDQGTSNTQDVDQKAYPHKHSRNDVKEDRVNEPSRNSRRKEREKQKGEGDRKKEAPSSSPKGRIKRKVRLSSPSPPPLKSPRRTAVGRPKRYKVDRTPPVVNGHRNCQYCQGQVRPQMCGGNKHRWRCVDKKCRKWYGWVKNNEEIPKDLTNRGMEESLAAAAAISQPHSPIPKRRVGRPSKSPGLKIKLNTRNIITSGEKASALSRTESDRPKRKYTKRKERDLSTGQATATPSKKEKVREQQQREQRELSPLTEAQAAYRPSAMERRVRWWRSEKRRQDYSPPRSPQCDNLSVAATFKMISQACMTAAVTRADEPGTMSGTLDLLMDTMMSSLGPMFSLLQSLPNLSPSLEISEQLWSSSLSHTPIFQ